MKTVAINGSPKLKDSLSGRIIEQMGKILGEHIEIHHAAQLVRDGTASESLRNLLNADTLLIVFSLYVDSLPAPLIEFLTRLEGTADGAAPLRVFAIVNCSFFEPRQTEPALEIIKHFADCTGFEWGYGLGIGGGPMLTSFGDNWDNGPVSGIHNALRDMSLAIRESRSGQNVFISAKFPRFLYRTMANMSWRRLARKNGIKTASLRARPYSVKSEATP